MQCHCPLNRSAALVPYASGCGIKTRPAGLPSGSNHVIPWEGIMRIKAFAILLALPLLAATFAASAQN